MVPEPIKNDTLSGSREKTRQEVCAAHLTELARRLGPGAQLPRFAQLRQELSVSGTTLIGALDDLEARGILVRRHGVGIFVARDVHQKNIVFLTNPHYFYSEGNASPFWQQFAYHAWKRAASSGMHFALHFVVGDDHDKAVSADGAPASFGDILTADLRQGRIHGVLGVGLSSCAVFWLAKRKIPLVAFAGYAPQRVLLDEETGTQLAIKALMARGGRRIALWTAANPQSPVRLAYEKTLAVLGLPLDAALVNGGRNDSASFSGLQWGEQLAHTVFGPKSDAAKHPDAVYCAEDTLTRGALPVLLRQGIRPGLDFPFATHANTGSPLLFGFDENLIRIESDPARVVEEMYLLLTGQMEGRGSVEECVILPPVVRLPVSVNERAGERIAGMS